RGRQGRDRRFAAVQLPTGDSRRLRQGRGAGHACSQRRIYQYKTKGHRVIAMPPCSTGLAPPAFTAPCRNQTSEPAPIKGKRCTCLFFFENCMNRGDCRALDRRISWVLLQICRKERQELGNVGKSRVPAVSVGEDRTGDRPRNSEVRIVPGDADLARRVVDVRALVLDLGGGTDDAESVRKAWRHVDLLEA